MKEPLHETPRANGSSGKSVGTRALVSDRACPLCGGTGRPWQRKRGFEIDLCGSCSNAFVPRELIPTDLEDLYSASYFEGEQSTGYPGYLNDTKLIVRNFQDRLQWIARFAPKQPRLLDVGAAYGLFLKAARDLGWSAEGVEIAPDCAAEAARISGAPVLAGDFLSVKLRPGFDVIVMLDVIEHMRDPLACVQRAYELLAPGGHLVIETGDHASPWARLLGERWYFLDPPQHLFYFSRRGLDWMLSRAGFSTAREFHRQGRRVSLSNAAFKLANELPGGLRQRVLERTREGVPGSLYLNFGDAMMMAAKRPV
ncbi:MAG TPA: class I SAM-dependent methyltransferase [Polyangiaceae bacterium]|nr:class I SAM-dependent methyltransferase [Polyangiaceae bacterium]